VFLINPEAWYTDEDLVRLGLDPDALAWGVEAGGLRAREAGPQRLYLGRWLLDWPREGGA